VEEKPVLEPTQVGDLRIKGKIDLDALNTKVRPDKKKKNKEKKSGEPKDQKKTGEPKADKSRPSEPKAKAVPEKAKPAPAVAEKVAEKPTAPAKPEPEFIETQYQKLEGTKLVGMIDLSQFEKPKPSSSEKKKRKRIKNKAVKVGDTGGQTENVTPSGNGGNNKGGNGQKANRGNDAKSEKSADKSNSKGNGTFTLSGNILGGNGYTYTLKAFDFSYTTTGLENVRKNDVQSTKVIRNGQLMILRDGKQFNILGSEIQ
jgi:translation initiation factor IF-2